MNSSSTTSTLQPTGDRPPRTDLIAVADSPVPAVVDGPPAASTGSPNHQIGLESQESVARNPQTTRDSFWARCLRILSSHISHMLSVLRLFFTSEGRELRHMTGIFFRLVFSLAQVIIISVVLGLSGSRFRSKLDPTISEFEDCDKLGIWNALWAVRAAFGTIIIIWEWRRYLDKRRRALRRRTGDLELANMEPLSDRNLQWGTEVRGPTPPESPIHPPPRPTPNSEVPNPPQNREPDSDPPILPAPRLPDAAPAPVPSSARPSRREPRQPPTAADLLFDRMDTFLTATGLIHFIVNHVWLYTTVHSCRINDPHIWYLGLGIASLGYLIVLELLLIAFIVFVLGPILLLILNLLMLCLGRPVDRHGNTIVRAEIPKMDQSLIDRIPLVVYIPPSDPPATPAAPKELDSMDEPRAPGSKDLENQLGEASALEGTAASKSPGNTAALPSRRRWFAWHPKRAGKEKPQQRTMWSDANLVSEGDPRFEKNEHPFVVLESNRATCSICLGEFVEPKRREGVPPAPPRPKTPEPTTSQSAGPSSPSRVEDARDIERDTVDGDVHSSKGGEPNQEGAAEPTPEAQEEGGIPGEPLRLLACGHVFHKPCLDTWLSTTSGRCPICNRKVEIPEHMQ